MKKKWLSLLLALALCLGLVAPVMAEETAQTYAYTCDKLLWLGPIPVAGLTVINNEYYVPLETLNSGSKQCILPISFSYTNDSSYQISVSYANRWSNNATKAVKPIMCTIPGLQLGAVTPSSTTVKTFTNATKTQTLPANAVYDLGGRYTMVRLKTLGEYFGYREDEAGIHICEDPSGGTIPTVTWEEDLAGQAAKSLRVEDTKQTLRAFHDYLINTLTHEDFIDNAYFQKNDPQRYERIAQMWEKYDVFNNVKLTSRYAVCQDYAELFQAMCLQAGIPCELVTSFDMDHTWNRVWLWGQWYHVDVTFDDPGPTPTLRTTYFLITPDKMMDTHVWPDTDCTYPSEYDPAWEQIDPKNLTTADQFRKCLIAQLAQGKTQFSLHPTTAAAYGGYKGPIYWAMGHCSLPGWGVSCGCTYNSATKSYVFSIRYT